MPSNIGIRFYIIVLMTYMAIYLHNFLIIENIEQNVFMPPRLHFGLPLRVGSLSLCMRQTAAQYRGKARACSQETASSSRLWNYLVSVAVDEDKTDLTVMTCFKTVTSDRSSTTNLFQPLKHFNVAERKKYRALKSNVNAFSQTNFS